MKHVEYDTDLITNNKGRVSGVVVLWSSGQSISADFIVTRQQFAML
jgi:hypothetical protein